MAHYLFLKSDYSSVFQCMSDKLSGVHNVPSACKSFINKLPMHPETVHTSVFRMTPVRQHSHLNDLKSSRHLLLEDRDTELQV